MTPDQIKQLQMQLNAKGANLKVDGILGPATTEAMNKAISAAVAANPAASSLVKQNDADSIVNAYLTGDWSSVVDSSGMPFSVADQQDAVRRAEEALAPAFKAEEDYAVRSAEEKLKTAERGFDEYLDTAADNFGQDKTALDQDAANKGVLFSGGRVQREKNLKDKYERDEASKRAATASAITSAASDLQYKYGDAAANRPSISQYYNLGGNTYNPSVATGGATRGPSISSVYNPSERNYQGTQAVNNKAQVQVRAASLLKNKGNKLVPYGYQNQF